MLKTLYLGASSACFELVNRNPYYAPKPYTVYLNGDAVRTGDTNVFSLFGLTPDTRYTLALRMEGGTEQVEFATARESCVLSVRDFGAVGDGEADDTDAIACAIRFLPDGGRLCFPPGRYLTRPQALKSHITLELADGAVLLGSPERTRYPILPGAMRDARTGEEYVFGAFEGLVRPMYMSLLTALYAEDITIIGPGTVDGNAAAGDFWTKYKAYPAARPRLLFFGQCRNIRLHGIRVQDAPSWQIHPYCCEDVGLFDVSVCAPKDSPNTDAVDPESCADVSILGCRFSVGDDCIAIKSGKPDPARGTPCAARRHTIRNCLMQFGHGAVTLGSETAGGVQDLTVSRCLFQETDRGLRIKTRRGRGEGCDIDGITFENIRMEGVLTPIVINMWYNCVDPDRESEYVWTREALPVDARTPHLGRFFFRDLDCTGAQVAACYVDGLPERPVDAVTLENVRVAFARDAESGIPAMRSFIEPVCRMGFYFDNVGAVTLRNVALEGTEGSAVIAKHCGRVDAPGFSV